MKRRVAVVGACLVGAAALGAWLCRPGWPPEPIYRGKALGAWLDDRRSTPQGPVLLTDEAAAAVRAIGPAALPSLLAWISASDPAVSRGAKVLLEFRLGLPVRVPTNQDRRMRAMYGFRALGPAASAAFPALVDIALHSPDHWQRGDAINALTESDADIMRRFAAGLKDPDREVRLRAVFALKCIRIAPDEVCLPALEEAIGDPDPEVRARAAGAIALFDDQLKFFAGMLARRDPEFRADAARLVGGFRGRARDHLPVLEEAARDDDPEVRKAAAEAVRQVRGADPAPAH